MSYNFIYLYSDFYLEYGPSLSSVVGLKKTYYSYYLLGAIKVLGNAIGGRSGLAQASTALQRCTFQYY